MFLLSWSRDKGKGTILKSFIFRALLKKELKEITKNYKLLITCCVFFLLGLGSPLLAKDLPDIIKNVAGSNSLEGFSIVIPEPTYLDAVIQYQKNLSQIGLLVLIFLTMGAVTGEKEKGTASFMLVKPVSRFSFLGAKLLAYWIMVWIGFAIAMAGGYLYTVLLFEPISFLQFLRFNGLLFIYFISIVTLTFMFSTVLPSQITAGVVSVLVWILITALSGLGAWAKFLPPNLTADVHRLILGSSMDWRPFFGSLLLIGLSIVFGGYRFYLWEP